MIQMIKLTKIVLINWMYFQKTTLLLEGNTVIAGVNGTGKSTIIDAIQMLLLGNKLSRFNANANAEKRNLESYVRGAVSTNEKDFLRAGDVITYLAMEVDIDDDKHVFGMNINYKYDRSELSDPRYFYINGIALNENMFVKDNYPKTYDMFAKDYPIIPQQTLYSYQSKIKEILGLKDSKKYFHTLSRAVGIKNISNCNDFMNEFVLDENPINVDAIKANILEIEKVTKTIEREQEKFESFNNIADKGIEIENKEADYTKKTIRKQLVSINLKSDEISDLKKKICILENKSADLNNKINDLKEEISSKKDRKNELVRSLDAISPDLMKKKEDLEKAKDKFEEIRLNYNTFTTRCNEELPNLSRLLKFNNSVFKEFYNYIGKANYSSNKAKDIFKDFREEASLLKEDYKQDVYKYESSLKDYNNQLTELKEIIDKLKNNKLTFNKKIDVFKDYIKQSLEEKHKEEIEVKFLCEYLEINDPSWQKAIEGYLNTQRFYLIVPNKYYKEAIKLYQERKDFCLIRIINGGRIPDFDVEKNTLGEFVESSNQTALNYARYVLNRVHCAKDIYDLENYDIAVTKDCMHYQNYSIGRLNIDACNIQYIGQNGIKNQLLIKQKKYDELNEVASKLRNEKVKCNETIDMLDSEITFATKIIEDNSLIQSIDEYGKLEKKIDVLTNDIKMYESDPDYIEISEKINKLESEIADCNRNNDAFYNNLISTNSEISACNGVINTGKDELERLQRSLNEYDETLVDFEKSELERIKISSNNLYSLESELKQIHDSITRSKVEIEALMKKVRDDYGVNIEPKYELIQKFIDERDRINQSVFKYNSKLIELKKKNKDLFFSQFLDKLSKEIEKAKRDIDNLNHSLKEFKFGDDFYKIKFGVTDNPDLKLIYDYAKKYNSDDSDRGLFLNSEVEGKDRSKIENLLNEYMFSDEVSTNNMIVDYRKYLFFDVEVYTKTGVKSLNKVMKSQSGGEVQVPFYILSGVAFQQTLDYKRNKDSLGIVLYDEAFDKMDSQRIQSMLEFYRDKLNLQLILATPGKLDSLVDNVETILAVIRDGENAIVSDISHEI